jgi:hypothetical protein
VDVMSRDITDNSNGHLHTQDARPDTTRPAKPAVTEPHHELTHPTPSDMPHWHGDREE